MLPKILVCLNYEAKLKEAVTACFEKYINPGKHRELPDDLEFLCHKYVANVRGLVDVDNDIIRAGIFNDITRLFCSNVVPKHRLAENDFEENIQSLISSKKVPKKDIIEYFQARIYSPCDAEIEADDTRSTVFRNILFDDLNYTKNKSLDTDKTYERILPRSFAILQAYCVNELYEIEDITKSREYQYMFRNSF